MISGILSINVLWLATVVLEAGILVVLFKRGLHRLYFRFTLYIAWQLAGDLFLACAQNRWDYVYYFGYWAVTVVSIGLTLAILYEAGQRMLRPVDPGQKIFSALVRWIAILVIALLPITLSAGGGWGRLDGVTETILWIDRGLRILAFGGGIGILMLGRWLGVSPREFAIGIVSGFVMSTYIHLMVATAVMHRTIFNRSTLSAIDLAGWALADLVWFGYALWSPKVVSGGPAETPPATGSLPEGQAYAS